MPFFFSLGVQKTMVYNVKQYEQRERTKGGSDMSLKEMSKVPGELLEKRIEEVKALETGELEQYAVVKDVETGEHYLHYRYIHRDIAAGGAASAYHHLMPLDSDDVLGILFGGDPYQYPDAWRKPYLRNGPGEFYVWFDPSPAFAAEEDEREAAFIRETLRKFKQRGSFEREDVEEFFRTLDEYSPKSQGKQGDEE